MTLTALVYLILPGILANMAPVLVKHVPFLAIPIDLNITWNKKPLFGKNKTYRGFLAGILFAMLTSIIQQRLTAHAFFRAISLVNYTNVNIWLFGFLIGFGVLFGDLAKSFIKRRLDIPPGARFFPWDQVDGLIGGLAFLAPIYWPGWTNALLLLVMVIVLHVIINRAGYLLKLKDAPW